MRQVTIQNCSNSNTNNIKALQASRSNGELEKVLEKREIQVAVAGEAEEVH